MTEERNKNKSTQMYIHELSTSVIHNSPKDGRNSTVYPLTNRQIQNGIIMQEETINYKY